jgi:hypothetical protein
MSFDQFAAGLARGGLRGYALGMQGQRNRRTNELADLQIEEAHRAKSERELLDEADSSAFGDSQPAAPIEERGTGGAAPAVVGALAKGVANAAGLQPAQAGQPTKSPDFLGQYNTALSNYMSMASNPKYKSVSREIMGRIDDLNKQADQVNSFMHRQATEAAFPHIKLLSDPTASDEAKSAAVTALATNIYPDGKQYQMVVKGDKITMLDENGQPRMNGDKPMETTTEAFLDGATTALETPESWLKSRHEVAKEARAEAAAEKRFNAGKTFTQEENKANREHAEKLDANRSAREEKRIAAASEASNKKEFSANVARDMGEWSKDERKAMELPDYKPDPNRRQKAYDAAVKRYAVIYGVDPREFGVNPDPVRVTPGADEVIDVEMGSGAPTNAAGLNPQSGAATPPAAAPPVPTPNSATARAGLQPRPIAAPGDMTVAPTGLERVGSAVAQGARDLGSAVQSKVPTDMELIQSTANALRADLGRGGNLTRDNVGQITDLAKRSDKDLAAAGLSRQEIQQLRTMAQQFGAR